MIRANRSIWALGLLLAIALAAPAPAATTDTLEFRPHTLTGYDGRLAEGEIAYLSVPERHSEDEGERIRLAVFRLESTSERPGPPIVYLAGGPGDSGIDAVRSRLYDTFMALRSVADVIAIDQRGTGRARPELRCPHRLRLPLEERVTDQHIADGLRNRLRRCIRKWERAGTEPAAYVTTESADDLEALRRALGVERIALWGGSYGTHLALATMRRHESGIARAALLGVEGPDHTIKLPRRVDRVLRKLSRVVARDPEVGQAIPRTSRRSWPARSGVTPSAI